MNTKNILITISIFCTLLFFSSCNYLDVYPNEVATEGDIAKNDEAAENFLYTLYSQAYLPDRHFGKNDYGMTSDEMVVFKELVEGDSNPFLKNVRGTISDSNAPTGNIWSKSSRGIQQCYTFISYMNDPKKAIGLSEEDRKAFIAEAKVIIAYHHFLLMQAYGPIILNYGTFSGDIKEADYPVRSSIDQVVAFIEQKVNEAMPDLFIVQDEARYGRITKAAAKAIVAEMHLYVASPLFNGGKVQPGNEVKGDMYDDLSALYSRFVDSDNSRLIPEYSSSKWDAAVKAYEEAIKEAENPAANIRLYQNSDVPSGIKKPIDPTIKALRFALADRNNNNEHIFANTTKENDWGQQSKMAPYWPENSSAHRNSVIAPTLDFIDNFYTENGLPIDEDPNYPEYIKGDEFVIIDQPTSKYGVGTTAQFHMKREPRFYAWIAFHNSYYELATKDWDRRNTKLKVGGKPVQDEILFQVRLKDNYGVHSQGKGSVRKKDYTLSGYLCKKTVHPQYSDRDGVGAKSAHQPIIRLAGLYLGYAEALIEQGNDLNKAAEYIDKVRLRAGLPTLAESWAKAKNPNYLNQKTMRRIVRQERTIELFMEGKRYWDIKRWLIGSQCLNGKLHGLNILANDDKGFFKKMPLDYDRVFVSPKDYLFPIMRRDIERAPKLQQNPGYPGAIQ